MSVTLEQIAALKPLTIEGITVRSLVKAINRKIEAAGIEFGEYSFNDQTEHEPGEPVLITGYRWLECSAVRGSNEGYYIHIRMVKRNGESKLIALAKTWSWLSAFQITSAATRLINE